MEENLKKKILYITGTRADYGLMETALLAISKSPKLNLEIIATGMHLMKEFGNTIKEIKKDKLRMRVANATYEKDELGSMAKFTGKFALLLTEKIKKIKPDIILLMGDRPEMLVGAVVGSFLGIKIVHIHGGEKSGTVDDKIRGAITELADLHLVATKKSAERLIKKGKNSDEVKIVGAPGLENNLRNFLKDKIIKKYKIDPKKPLLLVVQHPVSEEVKNSAWQMKQTMEAVKELKHQAIVVYPNSDAGGRKMMKVIEKYRNIPLIKTYKNISRDDFLGLMKIAKVMLGNSSSGIIEAASFDLPAINIGTRQKGREHGSNIIDVDYDKKEIIRTVDKAVRMKNKKYINPYFMKNTEGKIVNILEKD